MNPGEDPYTACIREVKEEAGLSLDAPALRAVLVMVVKSTGDVWVIFTFTASAPAGEPIPSDEGELRWVELAQLSTLPVLPDLPLLLPHVLEAKDLLTVRLDLDTSEADSLRRVEILGPSHQAKVLFERKSRPNAK